MESLIFGSLGIYAVLVGVNGNATKMVDMLSADMKGFFPWAVSAGVLAALYQFDTTKPLVGPFLFLAILGFIMKNFETLRNQLKMLMSKSQS